MAIISKLRTQIRWGTIRNTFFQNLAAPICLKYKNLPFGGNIFFIYAHLRMPHRIYSVCHAFLT